MIERARSIIHSQPPSSLLTLTSVEGMHFNQKVTDAMKTYAESNRPYVRAAALLGISGLKQIVFNAVKRLSGRNLQAFASSEDAKKWLLKA